MNMIWNRLENVNYNAVPWSFELTIGQHQEVTDFLMHLFQQQNACSEQHIPALHLQPQQWLCDHFLWASVPQIQKAHSGLPKKSGDSGIRQQSCYTNDINNSAVAMDHGTTFLASKKGQKVCLSKTNKDNGYSIFLDWMKIYTHSLILLIHEFHHQ